MRILILGANGMLGNAMLRVMSGLENWNVFGTVRSPNPALKALAPKVQLLEGSLHGRTRHTGGCVCSEPSAGGY